MNEPARLPDDTPAPAASPRLGKALWAIGWPFAAGLILMVAVTVFSVAMLMGVRVHATGQDVWSLGRKNATIHLLRYAGTRNEEALLDFDRALQPLRHLRAGRIALEQGDSVTALTQWESAGVSGDDVPYAVWMYRGLHWMPQYQRMLTEWMRAEDELNELMRLREELPSLLHTPELDVVALEVAIREVYSVDARITALERHFIALQTEMSHLLLRVVVAVNVGLCLLLLAGVLWRTREFLLARQRADQELAGERLRAAVTLASIADAVVSTNARGDVVYANEAALRLGGGSAQGAFRDVMPLASASAQSGPRLTHDVLRGAVDGVLTHAQDSVLRAGSAETPVTWVAAPIRATTGAPADGAVVVLRDVTREREMLTHMTWLADHDPLTGLPNRRVLERRLHAALQAPSQAHLHTTLMFIDVDQFKIVNDTCGHSAGDELLRQVAPVMQGQLVASDLLTRVGGDEFGVLLAPRPLDVAAQVAEGLRQAVAGMGFVWGLRRFAPTISIGLVHLDGESWTPDSALSAADVACYVAKDTGRNRIETYHAGNEQMASRFGEMSWVQRLQAALQGDKFRLYAQPIVALHGQGSPHVELLLRLDDEGGEPVAPGVFIPAAERFGLMPLLDRWVVDHALATIARRRRAGVPDTLHSINLSGSSFGQESFLLDVKAMIARHGVPPAQLCFEITETQAVENFTQAIRFITELRALGAAFALDDFGAGMSSFSYIKHLPVDYLKIDGMFVRDMTRNSVDRAIVEMSTHLARAMGVQSVGECAETPEVIEALRAAGVDHAQGWGLAMPAPFD